MRRNSHLEWMTKYQRGYIEIHGYNSGERVLSKRVGTTGAPADIKLKPDRIRINTDRRDVSLVTLEVVDDKGRVVPRANEQITLSVTNGRIIGVCNGDPSCRVSENRTTYPVFNGLVMLFVKAGKKAGPIILTAEGAGLKPSIIAIDAEAD